MYQIPQEEKDELFKNWIAEQRHRLDMLNDYGFFDRKQSIELLKIFMLDSIEEMLRYK